MDFQDEVWRPTVSGSEKSSDNLLYAMTLVAISNNIFVVF